MIFDLATPGTIYMLVQGKVFVSLVGGTEWGFRFGGRFWGSGFGLTPANVVCVALDPSNIDTIYAGTDGSGILKSTTNGRTWQFTSPDRGEVHPLR